MATTNINGTTKTTASLSPSCKLTVTDMPFGQFSPNVNLSYFSTSHISALCSKGISYSFYVNRSSYYGTGQPYEYGAIGTNGAVYHRAMIDGTSSSLLFYQLYKDSSYTQMLGGNNWGG